MMRATSKRKKKMLYIFLVPLIGIVVIQGALLLSLFFFSGVKDTMENNAVETATHILENRQMALQNTMISEWGSLTGESEDCSLKLEELLEERGVTVQDFLGDQKLQEIYLERIFPEMITSVQQKTTSGGFLILANEAPVEEASDYQGFFIRDSDPSRKTATNADLLIERGDKKLAREAAIPLDNPWSQKFHFEGKGKREADNFYYEPYTAGLSHLDTKMVNLGYWSSPFILEDSYMDSHRMITYSLPLLYDGTIYGVLGIEASLESIEEYMDVRGLDKNLNAGYMLVKNQGGQTYQNILGKGILYDYVSRTSGTISFHKEKLKGLFQVEGVAVGKQKIYAVESPMNLYSSNVPYENTQWELCALVTENYIFETARSFFRGIVGIVVMCALLGLLVVVLVVRKVLNPVDRLMDSVRGGVEGIRAFVPSQIQEIDELHQVVEHVTEAQKKTEDSLIEEKERYRLAIESSQDIFFSYRKKEHCLEVVNTDGWDGIWDCPESGFEHIALHPFDQPLVENAFREAEATIDLELRMKQHPQSEYEWYRLFASVMHAESGEINMIVGYLHNINLQKLHEQEEEKNKITDPATGFYNRKEGSRFIRERRGTQPDGVLFLLQLLDFDKLNEEYGLIFGDLVLEQLSEYLCRACAEAGIQDALLVRVGYSQIGAWFPQTPEEQAAKLLEQVRAQYTELIHDERYQLNFICGSCCADAALETKTLIEHVRTALRQAGKKQCGYIRYEALSDREKLKKSKKPVKEVVSMGYSKQMGLVSIALNLFDRGGSIFVLLDLLAAKLQGKYPLTNLLITAYNKENMVNSLEYAWAAPENTGNGDKMISCGEGELPDLNLADGDSVIRAIADDMYQKTMFQTFLQRAEGIAVNMMDNGQYSGTIFFEGIPVEILEQDAACKELKELATIIQNRINQEKHDLSAQAKADFLARMSHEIRTPMNGIIGMTEIALKEGQSPEKRVDCLQKIRGSSQYLLSLVNDILDMSKIDSGKMQITESKVNFKNKLCGLYQLIESKITEKHIHYTEHIELDHSWFWVDELRTTQVLINILGNAIKYTNEGGHIQFEAIEKSFDGEMSEIYFAVTDDGVGISPEDQQRVFQSFEQAKHQDGVYRQGTGLGLAISNRLIHLMGSSIELESEQGRGSTFHFTLRLKWVEAEAEEETEVLEAVDFHGKRILVVEDNELNREIITTILEDYGITVETAEDGQIAVDRMKASKAGYYDMILMDIMMPNLDGLEATREIRRLSRPDSRTIPIVAMTANAFAEEQKQSAASGMNAHLTKPLDIEKLQKTLKKYLFPKKP